MGVKRFGFNVKKYGLASKGLGVASKGSIYQDCQGPADRVCEEESYCSDDVFDRWGAVQMTQNLDATGLTVVPFGQGFKDMSPPTKELMKLVLEGKLAHEGHPVLQWMMENIFIRTDSAGNIKPDKENPSRRSTAWWPPSWASTARLDAAVDPPLRARMTEDAYFSCNVDLRVTSDETL